jgi:hypothetical protein
MTRYSSTMRDALMQIREGYSEVKEAPEDNMPASPDEGSMAVQQLEFMMHAIQKMKMHIQGGGEFPEWMQNKLSGTHEKLKGLYANIEHGDMNEELDLDEMKMDDPKLVKAFDKMKKGDTIKLKTSSTISQGKDFVEYIVKSKNVVNKGRVEKITLVTKGNEKAVKKFLYKRDGKVTFAIGDMGASIDDIKEGTWALPDSPKAKAELKKLMSKPIKLGKEGDEASDKLYALIGDDELFDDLYVAGKKNPNGDARDVVKKHMKRLGIKEEVELEEGKSSTGYELYHKDFSSAMAHAYDFAKKKFGIEVDPKEIDDKVASGPRKPSKGKTNSYRLKGKDGKKAIQVQVYGMDNGKYELNMYKEGVEPIQWPSQPLEEAMATWKVTVVKPVNKLKRGDSVSVKANNIPQALKKSAKAFGDSNLIAVPSTHFDVQKEEVELDEMREPYAVVDTADGNKVVGTASDEKGAKSIITSSELPPMKIKDKKTLKIVKVKKKQMIGQPIKEEEEPNKPDSAKEVDQGREDKKKTRIAQLQLQIAKAQETINKLNAQEKPNG